jgi:hypothetical protein
MKQLQSLESRLFNSSQSLAQAALSALEENDFVRFITSGSNGLEHLSKAVLFRINPTLIADTANSKASERSLLHLAGSIQYSINEIRTVSLEKALSRIHCFKIFNSSYGELNNLVAARNSYFHLAESPQIEPGVIVVYIQAVDDLIRFLGYDLRTYWSSKFDLSRLLLDDSMRQVSALVKSRVKTAEKYYSDHFGEILPMGLETKLPVLWIGEELHPCPVCNSLAIFEGDYDFDYEEDWDEDGFGGYLAINGRFVPSKMRCRICKLELHSQEELRVADAPLEFETEETPESLGWHEEPDEDFLRGR